MNQEEFNKKYGDTFYYCSEPGYLKVPLYKAQKICVLIDATLNVGKPQDPFKYLDSLDRYDWAVKEFLKSD